MNQCKEVHGASTHVQHLLEYVDGAMAAAGTQQRGTMASGAEHEVMYGSRVGATPESKGLCALRKPEQGHAVS